MPFKLIFDCLVYLGVFGCLSCVAYAAVMFGREQENQTYHRNRYWEREEAKEPWRFSSGD